MKSLGIFIALVSLSCAEIMKFNGYRVYRTAVNKEYNVENFLALQGNQNYSIWSNQANSDKVDIMVPPENQEEFLKYFPNSELFITDVQELINNERPKILTKAKRSMGWEDYFTYNEIYDWLKSLVEEFPDKVTLNTVGKSYEGRDIFCVHVSFNAANKQRGIVLEGGMHAREWIGVATVTYILNQILRSEDKNIREMAESHDWHVCPILNPDGYSYTFTTNRMWRKTRKPHGICRGADPNRNWSYKWRNSWNPCSESYPGPSAFSEPETKAMSEYLAKIAPDLEGYISFHAYSQLLLIPYGDSAVHKDNYEELYAVGKKMVEEIKKLNGTEYTVGNIVDILYPAYGNNVDWIKGNYKTRLTYIYELRDKGKYGFVLPANQIVPCAEEALTGLLTMFTEFKKIDGNV